MTSQFEKFMRKHHIEPCNILYLLRENGKTTIHLNDGRVVDTFSPLKAIAAQLEGISLLSVNKGVVLNEMEIVSVEKGLYIMTDGRTFQGRVRTPGAHNRKAQVLNHHLPSPIPIPKNLFERFSVLDHMPLAFCVIEIVFDQDGHGIDFIFRYCNHAMVKFEGKTLEEMLNHSCFEIFPETDKKWAISYADVALNGVSREIMEYSSAHGTNVTVHCFQPQEGYCACVLTEHSRKNNSYKS